MAQCFSACVGIRPVTAALRETSSHRSWAGMHEWKIMQSWNWIWDAPTFSARFVSSTMQRVFQASSFYTAGGGRWSRGGGLRSLLLFLSKPAALMWSHRYMRLQLCQWNGCIVLMMKRFITARPWKKKVQLRDQRLMFGPESTDSTRQRARHANTDWYKV